MILNGKSVLFTELSYTTTTILSKLLIYRTESLIPVVNASSISEILKI